MGIRGSWHVSIQWATIRYLLVCLIALIGMLLGSLVLKDTWIGLILGFTGYIVARIILLLIYGE
ncbi:MAG TPA: hypothetical protein PK024_00020 [Methanospirillum sp.]|uniref:hypothetical protein n=1 Tax=Methanospirillum sp. TaxID=45200 RepID=UPI002C506F49|nr:hypothetical protein [Methanospirillum sp.]HOJ95214.1 hypothetical protein [Methanospirillum sp.]HOL41467.1 hypothetical protein [Methanospirillum sp.]HPP76947.1 hypothetical protein [Methanospirillum sp.]